MLARYHHFHPCRVSRGILCGDGAGSTVVRNVGNAAKAIGVTTGDAVVVSKEGEVK